MNKVLYKIFGAMSKDSYGEICKYFGIDKVEESIRHRQERFVKRYYGSETDRKSFFHLQSEPKVAP